MLEDPDRSWRIQGNLGGSYRILKLKRVMMDPGGSRGILKVLRDPEGS